jgi:hypothetical protein
LNYLTGHFILIAVIAWLAPRFIIPSKTTIDDVPYCISSSGPRHRRISRMSIRRSRLSYCRIAINSTRFSHYISYTSASYLPVPRRAAGRSRAPFPAPLSDVRRARQILTSRNIVSIISPSFRHRQLSFIYWRIGYISCRLTLLANHQQRFHIRGLRDGFGHHCHIIPPDAQSKQLLRCELDAFTPVIQLQLPVESRIHRQRALIHHYRY